MGGITRHQEYRYQFKTIAIANGKDCGYGGRLNFNLPADFIEVKNLYMHLRVRFNASEPSGNQKIKAVGPRIFSADFVTQPLMKEVNLTADVNRYIDLKIDLSDLIPNMEIVPPALYQQGYFNIGVLYPNALTYTVDVLIWKLDLIYTTQGIR